MENIQLTGRELVQLFNAISPTIKGELVAQKLAAHVFILSKGEEIEKLYILQPNMIWKASDLAKDTLYPIITKIINRSYENIDNESKRSLEEKFEKRKDYFAFIKKCLS